MLLGKNMKLKSPTAHFTCVVRTMSSVSHATLKSAQCRYRRCFVRTALKPIFQTQSTFSFQCQSTAFIAEKGTFELWSRTVIFTLTCRGSWWTSVSKLSHLVETVIVGTRHTRHDTHTHTHTHRVSCSTLTIKLVGNYYQAWRLAGRATSFLPHTPKTQVHFCMWIHAVRERRTSNAYVTVVSSPWQRPIRDSEQAYWMKTCLPMSHGSSLDSLLAFIYGLRNLLRSDWSQPRRIELLHISHLFQMKRSQLSWMR